MLLDPTVIISNYLYCYSSFSFIMIACIRDVDETMNETTKAGFDEVCGLVGSTVSITAHQLVEPSETALRLRTVDVLRDAINGGEIIKYLPDDCVMML